MKKTRFVNNKRVLRSSISFHSETSVSSVIPNRAYTEAELAYRIQTGQPLPAITMYRTYDDNGLNKPLVAKDLISAQHLLEMMENNTRAKEDYLKQLGEKLHVSESEVRTKSDNKELEEVK